MWLKFCFILLLITGTFVFAQCPGCICHLNTNAVNFGNNYSALSRQSNEVITRVTAICQSSEPIVNASLTLSLSPDHEGKFSRSLDNGNNALFYNIYIDSNYQQILGDGTNGTVTLTSYDCSSTQSFAPYSCTQVFTLFAKIPASQKNIRTGFYNGQLLLRLTY